MDDKMKYKMDDKMKYKMDDKMKYKMDDKMKYKMDDKMDDKMKYKMDGKMDEEEPKMEARVGGTRPPLSARHEPAPRQHRAGTVGALSLKPIQPAQLDDSAQLEPAPMLLRP